MFPALLQRRSRGVAGAACHLLLRPRSHRLQVPLALPRCLGTRRLLWDLYACFSRGNTDTVCHGERD